ncbi:MAG: tRNA pseudouridine(38-40) synthase TruA [Williamsia sp.]|nr:tRNA pseudouridine(38-40) synthase TruA [Williamsia sp.]
MTTQRYFLELSYKGTLYSGFQRQDNANSIQSEVEKAFSVLQKSPVELTSSSRTDTGVHAMQNYFHFDYTGLIHPQFVYKMNAILPPDIVISQLYPVSPEAHCRYDASSREYAYYIYRSKNPFLRDRAYYYPYTLELEKMQEAARLIKTHKDFTSFSKRNTQVKTFFCSIEQSEWAQEKDCLVYRVKANRFLRGMVRGLTATMLLIGRGKLELDGLQTILLAKDNRQADFSVPGHGLFLMQVNFPPGIF